MKPEIQEILFAALQKLALENSASLSIQRDNIQITSPKDASHGDITTNIALTQSKALGLTPRNIAEKLAEALKSHPSITEVAIAGPGFINVFINKEQKHQTIKDIFAAGTDYGNNSIGQSQSIHIEYVSANPTGPLHVGHGRGAAYGASLANLLTASGYKVHREYYVNDAGRQMNILALSVWLRYLEIQNTLDMPFPPNAYQGDYIQDIANQLIEQVGKTYIRTQTAILVNIPEIDLNADSETKKTQAEARIDALIERAQALLGEDYAKVFNTGLEVIRSDIEEDLNEFGVSYDQWFSERSLSESGKIEDAVNTLTKQGLTYKKDGNLWFKSSELGDDKDRVIIRESGLPTYFASDIAYHLHKLQQGYNQIIDIWGADHHGYVARVNAAIQALSNQDTAVKTQPLRVLLVQFAILYRQGQRVQMSTRSGSFVTLKELRNEVGNDAARFFYVMRKSEQHMDFDLDLAKSQTKDNPVYYIQYAHARIYQLIAKAEEHTGIQKEALNEAIKRGDLSLLSNTHEEKIIKKLSQFPNTIERAATHYEPHLLAHYLRELASEFHTFYNDEPILKANNELMLARLALCSAVRTVIAKGLNLLGVSAPESM